MLLVATVASALEWQTTGDIRRAKLPVPASGKTGFTLMSPASTGVSFTNSLPIERGMTNLNLMNGSGVALGDYDGDGLCDIYLCDMAGNNKLFKNLGNWKFKEVTAEAGVACPNQTSTGAVFADVNGDGWLDLLVTSMGGPNALLLNEGNGHFTNVTVAAGLESKLGSTSMALADIDGNGTLDLYVANYGVTSIVRTGGELSFAYVNGKPTVRGRYAQRIKFVGDTMFELGEPDVLYLNDGKGKFTPTSWTDGNTFVDENGKRLTEIPRDQGLSVAFRDLNGDGYPDIYVCNDAFTPDRCWINDGHGHFRALPHLAWRSTSFFSMNADFADLDRDGNDDFLVVDMLSRQHRLALTQMSSMPAQPTFPGDLDSQFQMRRNTLFLSRGDGTYAEIAHYAGVAGSEWNWSCIFLDVDLDGWEDILISNGFFYNVDDMDTKERIKKMGSLPLESSRRTVTLFPQLATANLIFRNQHDLTFQETGKAWGFDSTQISNGTALGDLDNDGDLDVVVNCLNGQALIYRNDTVAPRIAVRLKGRAPNTRGIGAKIKIEGGPVTQSQEMMCGGRYVSGDDAMRVFAAGASTNLTIDVTWRSGTHSRIPNCQPNFVYEIDEAGAKTDTNPQPKTEKPSLFKDVSEVLGHKHHEELFDDFARQPLLPNRLSQLGPGVAWFDFDGDGREDLLISSGKGGKLAVYRNDAQKGFQLQTAAAWNQPVTRDQTAIVGWAPSQGATSILVGSANYEDGQTNGDCVLRYDLQSGDPKSAAGMPAFSASVGPLALCEMKGDGHMSLFVGGRVIPGRYPQAASSHIYHFDGSTWKLDAENSKVLVEVGLVSGAVWSDLDGDGYPELILACEWGPIRVFKNEAGRLHEITAELGLAKYLGWWTGVTTGDLDGDGRLEILAGNWGLNSPYRASEEHPTRLFFGNWNDTGNLDLLEAQDDPELGIVPRRSLGAVSAGLPFLLAKFPTYASFAEANVTNILGDKWANTKQLAATTLASTVFLNRGNHFDAQPLPREAQFTPAWAICVADIDGDGHEDVFLSQNFFDINSDGTRLDGGRGLLLQGDGTGKLTPVPGQQSGIKIYGEQRGAAVCDYDGDGRVDLVVTQNGTQTKLFHNENGRPGLRVRLKGREGNASGVGAQLRLLFGQRQGPIREIHAGSGYCSQDSAVQVLATPQTPDQIWVRWPGGKTATHKIPSQASEIELDYEGTIRVLR